MAGMLAGGKVTLLLLTGILGHPVTADALELDASIYGILISVLVFVIVSLLMPDTGNKSSAGRPHD